MRRRTSGNTPASGSVQPFPASAIGFSAGTVWFVMVTKVKRALGYDDSLDAFGVHGIGGTFGCERETEGLDVALEGEEGYIFEPSASGRRSLRLG